VHSSIPPTLDLRLGLASWFFLVLPFDLREVRPNRFFRARHCAVRLGLIKRSKIPIVLLSAASANGGVSNETARSSFEKKNVTNTAYSYVIFRKNFCSLPGPKQTTNDTSGDPEP
jgi:hypothetical protein